MKINHLDFYLINKKKSITRMIIKSLLESLNKALYEKVMWKTIDKNLRLSIASIISRNRNSEAEFIKPKSTATKDDLIPRYVAALLILHKDCPMTEDDIDTLKTFKLVGHKILELGGTLEEIQDLYVQNGGIIKSQNPIQNIQDTDNEIKEKPVNQIQQTEQLTPEDKEEIQEIIEDIPEGITSYVDIEKFVDKEYNDMQSICAELMRILESTKFELYKSFYKTKSANYMIYFTRMYTDINTLQHESYHSLIIEFKYFTKQKYKDIYSSQIIIPLYTSEYKLKKTIIDKKIYPPKQLPVLYLNHEIIYEACKVALTKFLYVIQGEFYDPTNKKEKYQTVNDLFLVDDINFNQPRTSVINDIILKLSKKYKSYKQLNSFIYYSLMHNNGNMNYNTALRLGAISDRCYINDFLKTKKTLFYYRNPVCYIGGHIPIYGAYPGPWGDSIRILYKNNKVGKMDDSWCLSYSPNDTYAPQINDYTLKFEDYNTIGFNIAANIIYDSTNYKNI